MTEPVHIGDAALYQGDCLAVLAEMADNSVDAVVTDPPYGLAQGVSVQGVSERIYNAIFKIGFPDLYEKYAKVMQGGCFLGVPRNSSTLRVESGAMREESGIGVPKSTVDLHDDFANFEIGNSYVSSSIGVADGKLPHEVDPHSGQFLGDFILKFGDMTTFSVAGNVPDSCLAEAFFGGFAMPIFAPLASGLPSLNGGGVSVIFGDQDIWFGNDTTSQAQTSPFIMAFPGTVNSLMLRFDLSGRPIELLPTHRASHLRTLGEFGGAELVRTFPTTGGLSSVAQPCRVRFIVPAADGAFALYWFHLWSPIKPITDKIIPRGGFMGKEWDATMPDPQVWREALRVLKPGGHLLAFAGTRTQHRMAIRIEDAGFEIRDMIAWVYGSGFPKSLSVDKAIDKEAGAEREKVRVDARHLGNPPNLVGGAIKGDDRPWRLAAINRGYHERDGDEPATPAARQWQGWGTALKPALEPITLARKPFPGTVAANVLAHGTGALNVDGCRVGTESTRRTCNGVGQSSSFNMAASRKRRLNGSATGRFPANLIHDGSAEVVGLFPERDGAVSNGSKGTTGSNGIYNEGWGAVAQKPGRADTGSAARFFYCAKASKDDRDDGCEGLEERDCDGVHGYATLPDKRMEHEQSRLPRRNHHPTVKPTALMRYLCRLITPPGGVVLDPFMGSGSTGLGAWREGFRFIGIEREAEYFTLAIHRLRAAQRQPDLFHEAGKAEARATPASAEAA
jgi:site-specific DNA-methyltransferase (adenine-specific)